jgi:hypothetical protein
LNLLEAEAGILEAEAARLKVEAGFFGAKVR